MTISKKFKIIFSATCSFMTLLTDSIPPKELFGSDSKHFFIAENKFVETANPHGEACFIIQLQVF